MPEGIDHRKKIYKDLVMMMPKSDTHIEETIDGEQFRYLPEPRCRVCSAGEARKGLKNGIQVQNLVDSLLLYPKSIADIYNTIESMMDSWPAKARITYKSIRTHQNRHLAWDSLAMRMMVERWAQEKGVSVLDAAGRMILTEEAWLEATAHFGWQRLLSGQLEPTWAETQKSFERMAEVRKMAEGEFSTAMLLAQLNNVIQIIREELPPERWPAVLAKLEDREPAELPASIQSADDLLESIEAEQRQLISGEE